MELAADDLAGDLAGLRRANPRGYGFVRRYWADAKRGLDDTHRNYARVGQIHDNIPEPELSTRTLGQTLTVLTRLGVVDVYTNRSNATIYDLTTYRPERLADVGRLVSTQ
jgi:hypothetical protein